jgi:histone deacetylase 6
MTHMLSGLAGGKVVVALEVNIALSFLHHRAESITFLFKGGYNLDSISKSALAVTRVLLGQAPDELPPLTASDEATETVWLVAKEQSKYWKNVDPKACEPQESEQENPLALRVVFCSCVVASLRRYFFLNRRNPQGTSAILFV